MNQQLQKNLTGFLQIQHENNEYSQIMGIVTGGKGREGAIKDYFQSLLVSG